MTAPITGLARWLIVVAVMLAIFMDILDITIVNISLPHMMGSLGANSEEVAWVLTSYMISAVAIMPLSGYLSDRFGRRRVLLFDIAAFTVASALCGLAQNLDQIVLFRVLQGIAGATLTPLGQSLLLNVFPGKERGKGMAIFALGAMAAPALGPTVGGFITQALSWRWVFFINVPVGIIAFAIALRALPRSQLRAVSTDWIGLALLVLAVAGIQLTLDRGELLGWFTSPFIQGALATGLIALVAFVLRSWNYRHAIVDLTLFRDRNFSAACLMMLCMGLGFFGSIVLWPQMIQQVFGYPPATTGYVLFPRVAIGFLIMPLLGTFFIPRVDTRWLIFFGIATGAYGSYMMSRYSIDMGPFAILLPGIVQGISMSFLFVPISTVAYETLDPARNAAASGLYNLVRILGGSIGIAVSESLLSRRSQAHWHTLGAHLTHTNSAVAAARDKFGGTALIGINLQLSRQALMLAFLDVFWLLAISYLLLLPFLLLAKPVRRSWRSAGPRAARPVEV